MSVINLRKRVNGERPTYDIYVGRKWMDLPESKWRNPFSVYIYKSEKVCLEKFITYFWQHPDLYNNVTELKGKVLACWCDEDCHAKYLCTLANDEKEWAKQNPHLEKEQREAPQSQEPCSSSKLVLDVEKE